ncbi:hypothetical protein [Anaerosporobacter faecicola]|uniref:hypothetical protein n=1 Tax=Anaerosporobacter faecicola TaxID=2718714 RepID=UPI00143A7CDD|nr:hypothetical protein [Anaerosporobacter faecicola]
MHLLKFLLYWIKIILEQVIVLPIAFLIYILCFRKRGRYNIVICEHIGDMLFTLGYLNAFGKEKNSIPLHVITTKKWLELVTLYPNAYDSIQVVKHWQLKVFLLLDHYQVGQVLLKKCNDITVVDPGNNFTQGYEFARRFPEANLKDCIKYGILHLDSDAEFETPVKDILTNNRENETKKRILLCPYASVTNEIDKSIYEMIVKEYTAKGYQLFTNVTGNQSVIEGTEPITSSLRELYTIGDSFACVIGLRSGILDLLSFCKCPIVAIYPYANPLVAFFNLKKTNPKNKQIFQYRLTEDLGKDQIEIMTILNELI